MDGNNPRPRNPLNGMSGSTRPGNEAARRPPGAPGGPPSSSSSATLQTGMSRAERFDDERRRITESCFVKVDDQGQLVESYITHIRVQEDAAYPQTPPPPNGNPSNKKPRVIIISVRSSGRVRIHKARENTNGTFSIGKTWNMEDITAIQTFTNVVPSNEEEAQHKRWAGDVGFTVTIAKPYYWEAGTAKEKEFFIGSMVKIYYKYTQGKYPILMGFGQSEMDAMMSGRPSPSPSPSQGRPGQSLSRPPQSPNLVLPTSPLPPGMQQSAPQPAPPPGEQRRPPPLRGEDRRPPPLSDDRRPPPQGRLTTAEEDRRPPPRRPPTSEGDRRPPPLRGDERRPPPLGDDRRPPPLRDDRRPPPQGRPSTGDEDRRPPPFRGPQGQGTPPVPPLMQGPDGQRRLRPRPSMEQNMRSPPSREQMDMRSPPSREQMRPMPGQASTPTPPPPLSQRITPQSRPKTPESGSVSSIPPSLSPGRRPQADDVRSVKSVKSIKSVKSLKSLDEASMDASGGLGISGGDQRRPNGYPPSSHRDPSPRGLRPGTSQSNASSAFSRNDESLPDERPPAQAPPERRRPPMLTAQSQRSIGSDSNNEFHTSAQSPPPPGVFPGRRPQEIPERLKPATYNEPQPSKSQNTPEPLQISKPPTSVQPSQPPPTSPLPEIPKVTEPKVERKATPPPPEESETAEPEPASPVQPASPSAEAGGEHRPGLGPMVKKKATDTKDNAANAFRKAAFAYGAFKPRAGGAGDKLFSKETKKSDEPDGISGVFVPQRPAPKEEEKKPESEKNPEPDRSSKERPHIDTEVVPSVTVSSPLSPTPVVPAPGGEQRLPSRSPSPEKKAAKAEAEAEVRRKKRRSNHQIKAISRLGIDPNILDGCGLEFETLLSDFGWGSSELSAKSIETLESDIKREIARVEAGSWLNHLEQKDDRVETVEKMLDRAIAECDELEGLLTLYNVELSSLNDDIAFIEAQNQGLQVQTANQKLLQTELQQLVDTISITSNQLEPLRRAPIGKPNGLMAIETSLLLLYKALITIDPAFVQGSRASTVEDVTKAVSNSGVGNSELATMRALQEKKDRYLSESAMFLDRLKQHMDMTFGAAFLETSEALRRIDRTAMPSTKANIDAHDLGRNTLWMFSPLILFAKETDGASWEAMIRKYQNRAAEAYQNEIRDNVLGWKRLARKPTGDEQDLLFTAQEKETESITGAARKLTVKRSQTLARGLRAASGEKEGKIDKTQAGKLHAFDVFSRVLEDIGPLLLTEQNFVTDFFHATSSDAVDFPDAVKVAPPEKRRAPNLYTRKQFESDRNMAKRVAEVMEDIFSFWPTEIQNLVEWAVKADPLQGVGILCAVDRKLLEVEDSNQDFFTRTLQKVHERLTGLFTRFVDEQIRAIEDTKVKIKKRKGVIAFMKTFPHFSVAIENMLPASDEDEQLEIRRMVNDAYQKINKAMFESLKVIAKESPAVMATQGQGDPEDKEALNYHILLIENMNHYIIEVDARADTVLLDWKAKAEEEMKEHMNLYVDAVIRRPLGKLLEFIESTETLLAQPGSSPQSIAGRSSHSRSLFRKLLNSYDAKEIRKGIEALKKRVDKHFGDADDPSLSRELVQYVLKECEKKYGDVYDRTSRISQDVYSGEVEMDWGMQEITAAFRR